jgi:hypothetical protein
MFIPASLVGYMSTQGEADDAVNSLVMTPDAFSKIACLDGRMAGIITECDSCQYIFNECLRKSLISGLISAQKATEKELGYALNTRYIREKIRWDGNGRYMLQSPGIESIGKSQAITALAGGPYPVSPFLIATATVEDSGQGMCAAVVPTSLVSNPSKLSFWDDQGISVDTQRWPGYPRRVGNDWEIPLGSRCPAPACNTPISAFHCEYTILETPALTCPVGVSGEIVPVYTGTTQIIPQARPVEVIEGGLRWFLPISALLDPAFIDENADLTQGEFWKLIQSISFACKSEADSPIWIDYKQDCICETAGEYDDDEEPRFKVNIINAARSVVEIIDCNPNCDCCKSVDFITVAYKTSPDFLGLNIDLGGIIQGMAYYVAAMLPMNSCGCSTKQQTDSFIETAQKAYTDIRINPVTGETFMPMKFGNLYGQLMFTEMLGRMPRFTRGAYL